MKSLGFLLLVLALVLIPDSKSKQTDNEKDTARTWSKVDSKAYARDMLTQWRDKQWSCLNSLWSKESAWRPQAYNTTKVMGKNAGGIPQLLGLDPDTPAMLQIERGLDYIYYRYTTPCNAWSHFKRNGWY